MAVKKYYAVAVGRQPGIYTQWFGKTGALAQVEGVKGARYKGFATIEEAREFIRQHPETKSRVGGKQAPRNGANKVAQPPVDLEKRTIIYTDGSSLGNPGPGGYGVVIPSDGGDRELSGGFSLTTNNRMELLACIKGLETLSAPSSVALFSDSRYVVDGITKGWARKWQRNGWRKSNGDAALNIDLWERLLVLCKRHDVRFVWVRGHAGNPGNERCDQLATQAAAQKDLPVDSGYGAG
ncbi:ribonuclease HI [Desulfosarcina ovata]|uniref:Ribonuclease H n=2 Tax=Desulfosarcina ovata TaxID=83564 RepID=A0A5K8AJW8_9BACT|nr:ribonuclease HI [Desulfosarcina ovata]BBO86071.1 ribonuclease H [Desulfosarcina ovata subsp. sediminis]BBO93007.1 ribonuclease H [Desulfosarcina ovata subsp. ovata]